MTLEQSIDVAVLVAKSNPEQVDTVIWLLLRPGASRRLLGHAVDELKDVYVTQHMCLADLVFWFVDGEPGLMKQLKDTGAIPILGTADAHEWLASMAWLLVRLNGDTTMLENGSYQPNWLCRTHVGVSKWAGIGVTEQGGDDCFCISVYNSSERVGSSFLYRVCCDEDRVSWPGFGHLGIEHEWEDCMPIEDEDDDYDDDYE